MAGKTARLRALRTILAEQAVYTHRELVPLLADRGHVVTQATLSRDLRDIGAVKIQEPSGRARYTLDDADPAGESIPGLGPVLADYAKTIRSSGNLVVITTPPGAAQVVARAVDSSRLLGVLGTVAGDDTVLLVVEEKTGGKAVAAQLDKLGEH